MILFQLIAFTFVFFMLFYYGSKRLHYPFLVSHFSSSNSNWNVSTHGLHLLILCMRLIVSMSLLMKKMLILLRILLLNINAWLRNSWKLIMLLIFKNLRLICFVKKRLSKMRKFGFLIWVSISLWEKRYSSLRNWILEIILFFQ